MTNNTRNTFTAVDISKLPKPEVIEQLGFERIYNEMRDQMNGLQPLTFTQDGNVKLTKAEFIKADNGESYYRIPANKNAGLMFLELDSEPTARQLQIVAYREMLVRQRTNDASLAVMLAYAKGSDLDHIAVRFNVTRFKIREGDINNNIDPVFEEDDDFRRRIQLSLEEYSTAGPEGAYVFHSLSADSNVKDASAKSPSFQLAQITDQVRATLPDNAIVLTVKDNVGLSDPMPGDVAITVLSRTGNGQANIQLQKKVSDRLNQDGIRPITDRVRERSANITEYEIIATLYTYSGPDSELVLKNAQDTCQQYVNDNHKLGRDITVSGIYAALHQDGVQRVKHNIEEDIVCDASQSAYCTNITIINGGVAS